MWLNRVAIQCLAVKRSHPSCASTVLTGLATAGRWRSGAEISSRADARSRVRHSDRAAFRSGSWHDIVAFIAHACPDCPAERDGDPGSIDHRHGRVQQQPARSFLGRRTERNVDHRCRGLGLDSGHGIVGLLLVRAYADQLPGLGKRRPREFLGRADVISVDHRTQFTEYVAASGSCRHAVAGFDTDADRQSRLDVASQSHNDATWRVHDDAGQGADR